MIMIPLTASRMDECPRSRDGSTGLGWWTRLRKLFAIRGLLGSAARSNSEDVEPFDPPEPVPIRLSVGLLSVRGNYRDRNEDRCFADGRQGIFMVSDGVGGHDGGLEASDILTRVLPYRLADEAESIRDEDGMRRVIDSSIDHARREMLELARRHPSFERMGATVAVAVTVDRALYTAHVGDCRVYLLRGGRLRRLTTDQTVVQEAIDAGLLTAEQARHHPWRNVVTNMVGVPPLNQAVRVERFELSAGDRLLLCSDGLSGVVDDERLRELLSVDDDPGTLAAELVQEALLRGSRDNVSCLVVDSKPAGEEEATDPVQLHSVA